MISRGSIVSGDLWQLQRNLKKNQSPNNVKPLTRFESWTLWTRAWLLAIFWLVRKNSFGEPNNVAKELRL